MSKGSELDSVNPGLWPQQAEALNTFTKMWYHVFLWALFSSILVHTVRRLLPYIRYTLNCESESVEFRNIVF